VLVKQKPKKYARFIRSEHVGYFEKNRGIKYSFYLTIGMVESFSWELLEVCKCDSWSCWYK